MKKKPIMERFTDFALKLSEPLGRFANTDIIFSIVSGLTAVMPIIMIGSIFLIFYVLGSPDVGTSGKALLPFLSPWNAKFVWLNNATLGMMALYCSVAIPYSYAERKKISTKSASLMGLTTFILFTIDGLDSSGGIQISSFSASGLFACIITSIVSVTILSFCITHNITIKMPASVPPNVGMAFASLIPYAISFTMAWLIRSVLSFDFVAFLNSVLEPIISGSDSLWTALILAFLVLLFWSVGLHGDNMLLSLFTPFGLMWLDQNTAALSNGTPANQLPNILAGLGQTGLLRLSIWTAAVWPLIFLMVISKNKFLKTLGWTTFAPGIFTIVEPVIYGLPIALNPYLMIPFIASGTISTGISYLIMSTPFMGKFYALVPWATPPFLLGPLGTGDWKTILIPVLSFIIGLVIYLPFWKLYVSSLATEPAELAE
ncbi:PTS sugar transporter subunit IIC [Vagococcus sp. BWB3-3]|uniref:Permease IIC component n=1 Tax=Vagococcus allomyrinae TaxID=2794353 RepID=A0A940ST65_9ENTE|nr:PTS transporter subunit EIIC [Vagococcus allomyrinae]MBP1039990.1 PTS sugar transporter subunit IIC [Vagococcus allomyrinae]